MNSKITILIILGVAAVAAFVLFKGKKEATNETAQEAIKSLKGGLA